MDLSEHRTDALDVPRFHSLYRLWCDPIRIRRLEPAAHLLSHVQARSLYSSRPDRGHVLLSARSGRIPAMVEDRSRRPHSRRPLHPPLRPESCPAARENPGRFDQLIVSIV